MTATMPEQSSLKIGEVARATGVTVETIRYYERVGLLEPAERLPASSYRSFSTEAVNRLLFIRRTQTLGFSLKEIRELLSLRSTPGARAVEVRKRVEEKLANVRQKIDDLSRIAYSLERLSHSCDGRGGVDQCVILDALDTDL